jgi:hypothetical protein
MPAQDYPNTKTETLQDKKTTKQSSLWTLLQNSKKDWRTVSAIYKKHNIFLPSGIYARNTSWFNI